MQSPATKDASRDPSPGAKGSAAVAATLDSLFDSGYSTGLVSLNSANSFPSACSLSDHSADSGLRKRETRTDSGLCIDDVADEGADSRLSCDSDLVSDKASVRPRMQLDRGAFLSDDEGDT